MLLLLLNLFPLHLDRTLAHCAGKSAGWNLGRFFQLQTKEDIKSFFDSNHTFWNTKEIPRQDP